MIHILTLRINHQWQYDMILYYDEDDLENIALFERAINERALQSQADLESFYGQEVIDKMTSPPKGKDGIITQLVQNVDATDTLIMDNEIRIVELEAGLVRTNILMNEMLRLILEEYESDASKDARYERLKKIQDELKISSSIN